MSSAKIIRAAERKTDRVSADDLHVFLMLANSASLSDTAREMKVPKSRISRVIARLEAASKVPLFDRSSRHFRLSDAGRTLRPHAIRIVQEMEQARATLDSYIAEPQGLLKINTSPAFAQGIVAPLLAGFLMRYPNVQVELVVEQEVTNLIDSDADVLLRIGRVFATDYIAKRLPSVPVWLCASPNYLRLHSAINDPSDLLQHSVIGRDPVNKWSFHKGNTLRVVEIPGRAIVEDAATCRGILEEGGGLGCLPSYLARPSIAAGRIVRVMHGWNRKPIDIHAMYRRHRLLSPKVKFFVEELVNGMTARR